MSTNMLADLRLAAEIEQSATSGRKLFDRLGGRATLERVHKIFYDKMFAHPWIGKFFSGIDQLHLENQQSDFMQMLFGGEKSYHGRMPIDAHMHIMITEELFALRADLLKESLNEANIPETEQADWLRIDAAFKKVLIKKSASECRKRFNTDEIIDHLPPASKAS
jgi:truncated hemoglobin YjbI